MKRIRKGMVLSAGLGTRLRPITEKIPKPLAPVLNVPNVLHTLSFLKRGGVDQVILNLFHLKEKMEGFLKSRDWFGLKIEFSRESVLLGTGGGVKFAEPFFKNEPFVVANCDFLTDIALAPFVETHCSRKALATMILWENASALKHYAPVGVDSEGRLCSLPSFESTSPVRQGIFTGVHILEPSTLSYLTAEPSGINQVLYPQLLEHSPKDVYGSFMQGRWLDTGTLIQFYSSSMVLLESLKFPESKVFADTLLEVGGYREIADGVWSAGGKALPKGVEATAPVIWGEDCDVKGKVTVGPFAIVGDRTTLGDDSSIQKAIALEDGQLASGQSLQRAILFESSALPV